MMKIIGLTGGIGSGKSTVADLFEIIGIPVYNSDLEAKKIMQSNPDVIQEIISLLGTESYLNKTLNRKYIAEIVFNNKKILQALNSIVHPRVFVDFNRWLSLQKSQFNYILKESALLLDVREQQNVDAIITVFCPLEIRISRLMLRDQSTKEVIVQRINNQRKEKELIDAADYLIINDERHSIIQQVLDIHNKLVNFV
ncbi:MAG: dephospho-CoA kinase [Saprospiraceae bacterium]|nr:dephospho-CoA kinase [Saprospiraceae bacterium]